MIAYPYAQLATEESTLSLIDDVLNACGRLDVWVASSGLLGPATCACASRPTPWRPSGPSSTPRPPC